MLTGLSLLALTVAADRRLDDLTQEIEARDGSSPYTGAGQRSMKLLGKFKRTKSQSYAPPKSHQKPKYHPPPQYGPPIQYAPLHHGPIAPPQYAPPHYGPPKPEYGPPKQEYGPPKHQYGPPKHQPGPPNHQYGPPKPEYGPPKPEYGPPKPQYGPPKGNYRAPTAAYGPPQPAYHQPSSAYVKPQPAAYVAAPPPQQQVYAQPSPDYSQPPYTAPPPPPPPSVAYAPLPIAPPAYSSPSITYGAIEPPQTDYNQPPLTLSYNSPSTNDDDDDDSRESTSSDDSSASNYNVPSPHHHYEPAEPKPSDDDVKDVSDDQVEVAPVLAAYVATESSVPPKQTEFIPSYPHYSDDTDNNHPETDDSPKQSGYASSIPNESVQETDNNHPVAAEEPQKGTEPEIISAVSEVTIDEIPTISPPVSADEALAYSPNFEDNSAFPDSTDHDFSSLFNLPSNFYKQTDNGADANKGNDFGFFQLGIFPKTSSFFEQNYNG